MSRIHQALQHLAGTPFFDDTIYFLARMPAILDPMEVTGVVIVALTLTFLATLAFRLLVLDSHHSQISAGVGGVCRGIDDLANWPDRVDDLRAGWVRHESSKRLNPTGAIRLRRECENVGRARFEARHCGLQYLSQTLVEQGNGGCLFAAGRGQCEMHRDSS